MFSDISLAFRHLSPIQGNTFREKQSLRILGNEAAVKGGDTRFVCFSELRRKEFLSCVVGVIIDSDHKRKSDDKQHWFLELIGQFKNTVQHSLEASTDQVLVEFRNKLS